MEILNKESIQKTTKESEEKKNGKLQKNEIKGDGREEKRENPSKGTKSLELSACYNSVFIYSQCSLFN